MPDATKLLAIALHFFDAAMAPAQWVPALEATVDLLRADHAMIVVRENASGQPLVAECAGMNESDFARFLSAEAACRMEPFRAAMPSGTAVIWSQLVSDRHFVSSEFYNEVVRPLNGFHAVAARQELPELSTFLAVCRPRQNGDFAADDAMRLQALLPSLATSLQLHHRLQATDGRHAAFATVLDRLEDGVILTDAAALPIFLNARATRIVAEADGLDAAAASLAAATPLATRRLHEAIAGAAGRTAVPGRRLRLARPSQRPPLLLTVLPISRLGAVLPGVGVPQVAIFIKETDVPITIDRAAMREAFHLTPRECDVATLLAGGLDLDRTAAELRIGRGTVRNHLMQIYEKTGVHSQGALVALLARIMCR